MNELFLTFLDKPTRENFVAVRRAVTMHAGYEPYSNDLQEMNDLYEAKRYAEVRERFRAAVPNLLLSPRAHMLLALAARHLGKDEDFEMERAIYARCLEGIESTGDGSHESPYLVLRTSDEYDLLMAREKQLKQQSLIGDEDRHLDRLECTDGTDLYFDITDPFTRLGASFGDTEE